MNLHENNIHKGPRRSQVTSTPSNDIYHVYRNIVRVMILFADFRPNLLQNMLKHVTFLPVWKHSFYFIGLWERFYTFYDDIDEFYILTLLQIALKINSSVKRIMAYNVIFMLNVTRFDFYLFKHFVGHSSNILRKIVRLGQPTVRL